MKQYTVRAGQNIYDVAMTLYGSIEGVLDLLVNNTDLSYETRLVVGQKLDYDEDFMINQNLVDWFNKKKVIIKNGCNVNSFASVLTQFSNHIEADNAAVVEMFKKGKLYVDYNIIDPQKPHVPIYSEDEEAVSDISTSSNKAKIGGIYAPGEMDFVAEGIVPSDAIMQMADLRERFKAATGADIELDKLSTYGLTINLRNICSKGVTLLPVNLYDREAYYATLATPKLYINQTGVQANIGIGVQLNQSILIDWGDGSDLEYHGYVDQARYFSHIYNNSGEHFIKIYGGNNYHALDLSQIDGIYNALETIYIDYVFITKWPHDEKLNRLFVIKGI